MPFDFRACSFGIWKRPYLDEFLGSLDNFEVCVFTASMRVVYLTNEYADQIIDAIDTKRVIKHRLYRNNCTYKDFQYVKELSRLGRDLSDVILVDDDEKVFKTNYENTYLMQAWLPGYKWSEDDDELKKLIPILNQLAGVDDVRPVLRQLPFPNN